MSIHKQTVKTPIADITLREGYSAVKADADHTVILTSDERGFSSDDLSDFCEGLTPVESHPHEEHTTIDSGL